ncbi:MAG: rhomboid family intramembrane serine protease, partial [Allosphingosinicella sp.]
PANLMRGEGWLTPLTSMFLHGGFMHIAGNMLFLLVFAPAIEDAMGRRRFLSFYLLGGLAATVAQVALAPASTVPMVGASGAISAVLGAYAILFGRNRVKVASPTLALWLNALWLMAAWIVLQVIVGYTSASFNVGIAFAAHIGGFIVGVALANPLLLIRYRRA